MFNPCLLPALCKRCQGPGWEGMMQLWRQLGLFLFHSRVNQSYYMSVVSPPPQSRLSRCNAGISGLYRRGIWDTANPNTKIQAVDWDDACGICSDLKMVLWKRSINQTGQLTHGFLVSFINFNPPIFLCAFFFLFSSSASTIPGFSFQRHQDICSSAVG